MWSIFRRQNTFEQATEHPQMTDVDHWSDLFESRPYRFQTSRNVLVKENDQVGTFRLSLAGVYPAADVSDINNDKLL